MLNKSETDENDDNGAKPAPGSTMTPKQVFMLKIAVIVMGVLLVVGFAALIVGIYSQSRQPSKTAPPDTSKLLQQRLGAPLPLLNVPLRPGTQILGVLADSGRLIVHLRESAGDEIVIVDLATGWTQQRITFRPQP